MRTMRDLRIGFFITGLCALLYHASCGPKKQANEGFPPSLEELNSVDYEDPFWKSLREKMGFAEISGSDISEVVLNASTLPDALTDSETLPTLVAAQTTTFLAAAEQTVCEEVSSLVDINPGNSLGLSGGFTFVNDRPGALLLGTKVYQMRYKLKGDAEFRQAILSVPVTAPAAAHTASPNVAFQNETNGSYGYPVVLYGHMGDSGLAYEEIATVFGTMQSTFIIAAPVFPGEPLCATYDKGTATCTGANILSAKVGTALPYENDVTDYLGLHDCVKTLASGAAKPWANPVNNTSGTEDLSSKILKISAEAQTFFASTSPLKAAAASAPVSVAVGFGRGAAVAGLALARAGAYNSVFGGTDTAAITALAGRGVKAPMFSCALMASPQASFASGTNRLLLEAWVRNSSNALSQQSIAAAEAIPGFKSIHAKIKAIRDGAGDDEAKTTAIKDYVNSIDLVAHTSLLHAGLLNFGKLLTSDRIQGVDLAQAERTRMSSYGAALILHGTKDKVATFPNSAILSNYGVGITSALIEDKKSAGIHWLSLGITPPETLVVDEEGNIAATDTGHVNSPSFSSGLAQIDGDTVSNVVEDAYVNLKPADVIAKWAASECVAAMTTTAEP